MQTVRLTMAQALVRYLIAQKTEIDGETVPLFPGVCPCSSPAGVHAVPRQACRALPRRAHRHHPGKLPPLFPGVRPCSSPASARALPRRVSVFFPGRHHALPRQACTPFPGKCARPSPGKRPALFPATHPSLYTESAMTFLRKRTYKRAKTGAGGGRL